LWKRGGKGIKEGEDNYMYGIKPIEGSEELAIGCIFLFYVFGEIV
jgi:hypothetical protein